MTADAFLGKVIRKARRIMDGVIAAITYCAEVCTYPFEDRYRFTFYSAFSFLRCYVKKYVRKAFASQSLTRRYLRTHDQKRISAGRVVHVIPNIEVGGSQKIVFDIASGLPEYTMDILDLASMTYYDGKEDTFLTFRTPEEAAIIVNSKGVVLGHIHYYGDHYAMHRYLRTLLDSRKVPRVRWIENANNPIAAYRNEKIEHYLYVSRFARLLQEKHVRTDRVVYPGVDTTIFAPRATPPLSGTIVHIGFVYRLENDKVSKITIETIIQIIQKLKPNVLVHIVGDGSNFFHYVSRSRQEQVRKFIQFHGVIPFEDLACTYETFDLFIAPVHTESYGSVVPMAMAKGIPVVATNVGALPEILGAAGYLCRTNTEFVNAVAHAAKHPEEAQDKAERARLRVIDRFSLDVMIDSYRQRYAHILRK